MPVVTTELGSVTSVRTWQLSGRLRRPWGPGHSTVSYVVVEIESDRGHRGTGFAWTPTVGAEAITALVERDVAPTLLDQPAQPEHVRNVLRTALRDVGDGGLVALALAAVDLALWDLTARAHGLPVATVVGAPRSPSETTTVPCYWSGINYHYGDAELAEQVERWLDAGASAVKVKVGQLDLADDVRRLGIVRSLLGPARELMIDANQRWDRDQARRAVDALHRFGLRWIEEPLHVDDLDGHVALAEMSPTPIALGENLHRVVDVQRYVDAGACAIVQPNVVRVGGITPFCQIVRHAEAIGVAVIPHMMPELSAPLLATLARPTMVEIADGALLDDVGVLAAPAPIRAVGDMITIDRHVGLGLEFRRCELAS